MNTDNQEDFLLPKHKNTLNEKYLSFSGHIKELRNRIIYCLLFFIAVFIGCYIFSEEIYRFLLKPLIDLEKDNKDFTLIYTGMAEAFFVYLKVSFLSATLISFPFVIWNFYMFIAPGMYKREKKIAITYIIITPLFFCAGSGLAYYYIFPLAWTFFISFSNHDQGIPIEFMPSIQEYLDLVVQTMFSFGIAFQIPVLLTICVRMGVLSTKSLMKKRRIAIVVIFIMAAILTPPDVASQIGLAVPMLMLYELSIVACRTIEKND